MKCRACYKFVLDDAAFCEHCGAGLSQSGPKLPHAHDGRQHHHHRHHEPAQTPRADPAVSAAAIEKLRTVLTASTGRKTKADIWQRILDKHARGEFVYPHSLRMAQEAMGLIPPAIDERRAVDEELKAKGVVRVPGEDDQEAAA